MSTLTPLSASTSAFLCYFLYIFFFLWFITQFSVIALIYVHGFIFSFPYWSVSSWDIDFVSLIWHRITHWSEIYHIYANNTRERKKPMNSHSITRSVKTWAPASLSNLINQLHMGHWVLCFHMNKSLLFFWLCNSISALASCWDIFSSTQIKSSSAQGPA